MTPEQQRLAALAAYGRGTVLYQTNYVDPTAPAPTPTFLQQWGLPIAAGAGALLAGLGIAYAATR